MADVIATPTPSNGGEKIVRSIFKAIFPALLLGLVGMILFIFVASLFASIYSNSSGASMFIFANTDFMALLGFFIGFGGYLGLKFEEYI